MGFAKILRTPTLKKICKRLLLTPVQISPGLPFFDNLHFWLKLVHQARIKYLKEVSQFDEIAVFPFVSNSDLFDLSHLSLSELRRERPRYASDFMMLLIDQ